MRLVTVTDDAGNVKVRRIVSASELSTMSGVELAGLLFPDPTSEDITGINGCLDHYRSGARER